jgi:hypothetical protein
MKTVDHPAPESLRFYPETVHPFRFEPTRDRFSIRQIDDNQGQGIFSLAEFAKGDVVFAFTGFFSSELTQFSLQVGENLHLHDPYFYGKILHSCDPNCSVDLNRRVFIATKPISSGDLVTMDYAQTEDILYKVFPCSCGSTNCRGMVVGKKQD